MMEQEYKDIIWELLCEARKLDRFCMTHRQWQEFEVAVYDLFEEDGKK